MILPAKLPTVPARKKSIACLLPAHDSSLIIKIQLVGNMQKNTRQSSDRDSALAYI